MNSKSQGAHRLSQQFIRFVLTGICATGTQYTVLWLFLFTLLHPAFGSAIGYLTGALVSYLLSYYYTFQSSKSHNRTIAFFCLMVLLGLCVNSSSIYLFMSLGWSPWVSQVAATAITLCCNFVFAKLIVF